MIDTGIYHPFNFVDSKDKISIDTILKVESLSYLINGDSDISQTLEIKDFETDAVVYTATEQSFDFGDNTIKVFEVEFTPSANKTYYIQITSGTFELFSHCLIEYDCGVQIYSTHDCGNQYYDWDNLSGSLKTYLFAASEITPVFKKDSSVIITEKGSITQYSNFQQRHRIEFIAPSTMLRFLEGLQLNSQVMLETALGLKDIVNLEIENEEQGNTLYSKFVLSFVFKSTLNENDACCVDVNIDDIQNENPGSTECGDFTAEITESSGTLTVTLTNAPVGTALYKWYRDNVYLSNATSITVEGAGNYRVDVTVEGCRATASWFKDDVCRLFQIQVTKTGNEINATASNIPEGETVLWSVEFEGVSVSSTIPYTALASGIYYIRATAGECSQIKGVNVILEDDDCDFTIDITDNTTTLEADTDAGTPTYLWELETGTGRTTIGSTAEITPTGKGIYWLTITNGGCSKETYLYKEPLTESVVYLNSKATGTTFAVGEIDLSAIVSPATELEVYVNGVMNPYISTTPTTIGFYTINASNEIQIFQAITNGTIKVIKK